VRSTSGPCLSRPLGVGFNPLLKFHLELNGQVTGEVAIVIVEGNIEEAGERIQASQMFISKTTQHPQITLEKNTRLLLFGGQPLPQEPLLLWNFVSYNKDKLQTARRKWQEKKFPKTPGDNT